MSVPTFGVRSLAGAKAWTVSLCATGRARAVSRWPKAEGPGACQGPLDRSTHAVRRTTRAFGGSPPEDGGARPVTGPDALKVTGWEQALRFVADTSFTTR